MVLTSQHPHTTHIVAIDFTGALVEPPLHTKDSVGGEVLTPGIDPSQRVENTTINHPNVTKIVRVVTRRALFRVERGVWR